jgi:hypothetical protein
MSAREIDVYLAALTPEKRATLEKVRAAFRALRSANRSRSLPRRRSTARIFRTAAR